MVVAARLRITRHWARRSYSGKTRKSLGARRATSRSWWTLSPRRYERSKRNVSLEYPALGRSKGAMASSLASGIFVLSHDVRLARTRSRSRGRESTARSYVRSTSGVKATHAVLAQPRGFLLLVALLAPGCLGHTRDSCNPEPRPGELGT